MCVYSYIYTHILFLIFHRVLSSELFFLSSANQPHLSPYCLYFFTSLFYFAMYFAFLPIDLISLSSLPSFTLMWKSYCIFPFSIPFPNYRPWIHTAKVLPKLTCQPPSTKGPSPPQVLLSCRQKQKKHLSLAVRNHKK